VIPQSAIARLTPFFSPDDLQRGLKRARDGLVQLVRSDWPIVAQVQGTPGHVVTVHYTEVNDYFEGECSCGPAAHCQHAAAAALIALANLGELNEHRQRARKQQAVSEWVGRLAPAVADEPGSWSSGHYTVTYVLAPGSDGICLNFHRTSVLVRGGFGANAKMHRVIDHEFYLPRWIDEADRRRMAALLALNGSPLVYSDIEVEKLDSDQLADLAGTGRLFWESVGLTPLRPGPPRSSRLGWRPCDDSPGDQQVAVVDDLVLLPAVECHYIDLGESTIGPLDVGVPSQLVRQLVDSPPVPTVMLPAVQRSLRPLLSAEAARSLAPDEPGSDQAAVLAMQPHLYVSVDRRRDGTVIDTRAEAVYGDDRFELAVWDAERPFPRDMGQEYSRRDRLEDLLDHFAPRADEGSAQALLDQARYIAQRVVPALIDEGWDCQLHEDVPAEAVAVADGWVEALKPRTESYDWFSLELGVVVAGRTVSLLPILLKAIHDGRIALDAERLASPDFAGINLELPDGALVYVPGRRLSRWLRPLIELELRGLADTGELVVPTFTAVEIAQACPGRFSAAAELDEARARVRDLVELQAQVEPDSFAGTLRPYQRLGLAWLTLLHQAGYGGLLADEMGLGKTVQVLALLEQLRRDGGLTAARPVLVVAPRSVVGNWRDEAHRFTPQLTVATHVGPRRARAVSELCSTELVITSYQTLARDRKLLTKIDWTSVLFDEAQALKNPSTQLRRAAAALTARSRFCITGTPVENHLRELWSQLDLVMPGLLGGKPTFEGVFRRPIEKYGNAARLDFLRQRTRPFLLRRRKRDVQLDLPAKTEIVEHIALASDQRDLYESLRLSLDRDVRKALAARGVHGSSLVVLDALLKLRQCCCHPALINTPQAQAVEGSAKLERLMSMLEELAGSGRSVLVFSQFTSMLRIIGSACDDAGINYLELTGATNNRDQVVRAFQAGAAPVFLLSLKAGGTGLNLTRADTVIHYDPWWNPAAEDQATDRAHRIGQDRPVFVYKLVARGTLEDNIITMQREKRDLTLATLEGAGATHMTTRDLAALYHQLV
jgi:superfamily II DNA or RNA helicase